MPSSLPVLVAIPDEWLHFVVQYLEQSGVSLIATNSREETLGILRQEKDLQGFVVVSDWAMASSNGEDGLLQIVKDKLPTVTIITDTTRKQSGYLYMDEVFFPPNHEYITTPLALDELVACMRKVKMI